MLKKALSFLTILMITLFIYPLSSIAVTYPKLNSLTLSSGTVIFGTDTSTRNYGYAVVDNDVVSIIATPDTTNADLIQINGITVANNVPSLDIALNEGANIIHVDIYSNSGTKVRYKINVFRNYASYTPGVFEVIDMPQNMAIIINDALSRGRSSAPLTTADLDSIQTLNFLAEYFDIVRDLTSLDGLQHLHNLESLTFTGCSQIANVDALQSLEQLSSLSLNDCNISEEIYDQILDIISDKPMTTLAINYLSSYKRTLTAGQTNKISAMAGLKELSLKWNGISNARFLTSLINLEKINISRNAIADVEGLDALVNLKSADISSNYLDKSAQSTAAVLNSLQQHASLDTSFQNKVTVVQDKTDKNLFTYVNQTGIYTWSTSIAYGKTVQFLSCDPRQGYTFLGWDTDNNGVADYQAGDIMTIAPAYDLVNGYTQEYRAIYSPNAENAYLSQLGMNSGTWENPFSQYTTQYMIEVNNPVDSVSLDIVKDNENASYTIINDKDETLPNPVPLQPGMNFINIKVTSESGTYDKTYYLHINRSPLFEQGDGTEESPFGIATPEQLNEMRRDTDAHYMLVNDIDMTAATSAGGSYFDFGAGWLPLQEFSGVLDGNGKSIIGLHTNRTYEYFNGLISVNTGTIKNLGMLDSQICGGNNSVGGIVGVNKGRIEFCYNTGHVVSNTLANTGGIAGEVTENGLIVNCYNTGAIDGTYKNGSGIGYTGGIAGCSYYNSGGTIRNCFNAGRIQGLASSYAAGILGWGNSVENCYNVGNIISEEISAGIVNELSGRNFHGLYYLESEFVPNGAADVDSNGNLINEYANKKTDEEMRDETTYAEFDFDSVWTIGENLDYPYPELVNMPQIAIPEDTTRFAGGNGLCYNPYQISTPEQLNNLRTEMNAYFALINDIDMTQATHEGGDLYNSGKGFEPIGTTSQFFNGYFYGQGYSITGLYINRPAEDYGGLFGPAWKSVIDGLNMKNVDISAIDCGGICAQLNNCYITNCSVSGKIGSASLNSSAVGGIAGSEDTGGKSYIRFCRNLADIDVGKNSSIGGIMGYGPVSEIAYCYNAGDITIHTSTNAMGGIVGENNSLIIDCFNLGLVKCLAQTKVYSGGIAGYCGSGKIERCYNVGQVDAGIIGGGGHSYYDMAAVNDCYYLNTAVSKQSNHGESKTADEMKAQSAYQNYDFDEIWMMAPNYPVLRDFYYDILQSASFVNNTEQIIVTKAKQLQVAFSPQSATNLHCVWQSSNPAVATIQDGVVTGVAPGTAVISFSTAEGGFTDQCTVNVVLPEHPITGLTLNKQSLSLNLSTSERLTATITPENAEIKDVVWTSDKPSIAKVDENGLVTSLTNGIAVITAKSLYGDFSAQCTVTSGQVVRATGIDIINGTGVNINIGARSQLTAKVLPTNATNKNHTWSSSDNSVATVGLGGIVTGISKGTVTITATAEDGGYTDTCIVTVVKPVTSVSLNSKTEDISVGNTVILAATASPSDATYTTVTWFSSKTSVATVDQNGKVIAISPGTATITVRTTNGSYTDTCVVTVVQPVTSISLVSSLALKIGEATTINASVLPVNATNPRITWSSDNEEVATVNQDGKVSGKNKGSATITATADGKFDTCTVTVTQPVSNVRISDGYNETMSVGTTQTLSAIVSPSDATNKPVTWSSRNPVVATVDQNGKVTAVAPGSATITATADGVSGTCQITVSAASVSYQSHVQNIGWQDWKTDGESSGTSGQSLRLEAIRIKLDGIDGGIEYRTHVQNIGWMEWVPNSALSGTSGQSLRLEAIGIRLTGEADDKYDVYYRVHAQNFGWMGWAKNGESAGTAGFSYRLEAIQIKLVAKGGAAPGSTDNSFVDAAKPTADSSIIYQSHVQNIGWQDWKGNGEPSGTSGQSLRLEAMCMKLENIEGGIEYRTHVQNIGWMDWVSNGALSGTSGQSLRLEAIEIRLTGAAADKYDVYYRVHAQNFGWMGWAKNGMSAGTAGFSYRLEAIQIILVSKGGVPPGNTVNAFVQNRI